MAKFSCSRHLLHMTRTGFLGDEGQKPFFVFLGLLGFSLGECIEV